MIGVIYDLFVIGPAPLRAELQWLILESLRLSNVHQWLAQIAKELLNLLAGEVVFAVPGDAPSRRRFDLGDLAGNRPERGA